VDAMRGNGEALVWKVRAALDSVLTGSRVMVEVKSGSG